MNTPTHLLLSAALLAKPGEKGRNWAAIAGSLVPDMSLYVMWANAKFVEGLSDRVIFGQLHFSDYWQLMSAVSNSVPIYIAALLVGLWRNSLVVTIFCISGLIHFAGDFPVHRSDAYRYFWPFSDWRFYSPFSYWNPRYYGNIISMMEIGLVAVLIVILWRRFENWRVRGWLLVAPVPYFAHGLYF